jgi:hypothetical protein
VVLDWIESFRKDGLERERNKYQRTITDDLRSTIMRNVLIEMFGEIALSIYVIPVPIVGNVFFD